MAQTKVLDLYNHPNYTDRGAYVQQQVERIFKTPKGSVPGRINFGSLLHTMVSYPASEWAAIVDECYRAMDESADYWIKLVQVEVDFDKSTLRKIVLNPVVRDTETDRETSLSEIEVTG